MDNWLIILSSIHKCEIYTCTKSLVVFIHIFRFVSNFIHTYNHGSCVSITYTITQYINKNI